MNNEADATIEADGLAVTVEMGHDFTPGPRTAAALAELVEALHDEHGPETSGYQFEAPGAVRNFAFATVDGGRYEFYEAWPSKWKGFSLDGKSTDL